MNNLLDVFEGKDERSKYVYDNKVSCYKRKVYTKEVLLSMDKYKNSIASTPQISNYILLAV